MTSRSGITIELDDAGDGLPDAIIMTCCGRPISLTMDEASALAAGLLDAVIAIEDAWATTAACWSWSNNESGAN